MKVRFVLLGLILAVVLAAAGCGGSGGGGGNNQVSAVAGTYIGSFSTSGNSTDVGVFAIELSSGGSITGRSIDTTSGQTGLTNSGTITFVSSTATTNTYTVSVTSANGTATGRLVYTLSTHTFTGSITNSTAGVTYNFTSGLVSTASGGNTYAGFYSGTYTVNGAAGSPANTFAMIIDGNGHITAVQKDNISGQSSESGVATGTVNSSTGAATIGSSTGTLSLSGSTLTGNFVNSGLSQTDVYTGTANS